jgi:diaminopimelate decarboxylase
MFLKWFHHSASVRAIRGRLAVGLRVKLECHDYQTLYSAYRGPNARFGILPVGIAGCLSLLVAAGVRGFGFHLYPGTNVLDGEELMDTYRAFTELLLESLAPCRVAWKQRVRFLDFGGGFGINYGRHEMLSLRSVGGHIRSILSDWTEHDVAVGEILLEPGRSLIGPAGVLAATVVDVKEEPGRRFVVLNSGLSHFARPYIYQDQHQVFTLDKSEEGIKPSFVVGSTMASGDFLAGHPVKNVTVDLPRVKPGDVLCILDAGAYGFCMSSNFSGLLKPAEILVNVKGGSSRLIRHHQTVAEMLAGVPL